MKIIPITCPGCDLVDCRVGKSEKWFSLGSKLLVDARGEGRPEGGGTARTAKNPPAALVVDPIGGVWLWSALSETSGTFRQVLDAADAIPCCQEGIGQMELTPPPPAPPLAVLSTFQVVS